MAARKATIKKAPRRRVIKAESVSDFKESEMTPRKSLMPWRRKLIIAAVVLALVYFLFSSKDLFVAATVNGYPISRVSVIRELEKQGGQQVLDNLISKTIISQEARKAGINVSESDIDAKVGEIKTQLSAQGQDVDALLSAQGVSQEDFRDQIKTQIYVEKLIGQNVNITDEQINEFIKTNKDFLPADLDEEGLKSLARQELTQQELTTKYSSWIAELKQKADINYFVEY